MPPLATSMATSMATDMQPPVAPPSADWHLAYTAPQASVRRLPDDSNVTKADGDTTVQAIVDTIEQADKAISHVPYVLGALAAGDRPAIGPNLGVVCDGSDYLAQMLSDWDAVLGGNTEWSLHVLFNPADIAGSGGLFGVFTGDSTIYQYARTTSVNGYTNMLRSSPPLKQVTVAQTVFLNEPMILSFVRSTAKIEIYYDGVKKGEVADTATLTAALTGFIVYAGTTGIVVPYKSVATFYEHFIQAAAIDAAEVAAVVADMRAYWAEQGVVDWRFALPILWGWRYGDTAREVTASGELVSWQDYNRGLVVTAPSATNRPADGTTSWVFDGAAPDRLQVDLTTEGASLLNGADQTVFLVLEPLDIAAAEKSAIGVGDSTNVQQSNAFGLSSSSRRLLASLRNVSVSSISGNTTFDLGAIIVAAYRLSGGNGDVWYNGVQDSTPAAVAYATTIINRLVIGAKLFGGTFTSPLNANLHEVLVCDGALSDAKLQEVSANLQTEWVP